MSCARLAAESPVAKKQEVFIEAPVRDGVEPKVDVSQQLLAVVSHDLRTPLNTLLLAVSVIANRAAADPAYSREAAIIRRAADQMLRLVSDLLDASLLEVSHLRVLPQSCAINDLMPRIVDLLEPLAREKNIKLRVELEEDLTIWADPERMVQVLCNLITNAIKFTPSEGFVTVYAGLCGAEVRFTVRDTGAGIDSQDLPRIFEQYWQSAQARKGGAGLGLFIAKALVGVHGGRIWAESEVGCGTTFYFTVPTPATQISSTPEAANALAAFAAGR